MSARSNISSISCSISSSWVAVKPVTILRFVGWDPEGWEEMGAGGAVAPDDYLCIIKCLKLNFTKIYYFIERKYQTDLFV